MAFQPTTSEMSDFLPAKPTSTNTSKSMLLCIAEILRLFTDSEHGLRADDIRDILESRFGKRPSESKVLDDIHEIQRNAPFGMEVSSPSRGKTSGFRCTRSLLTSSQARALINMVQTSKFITPREQAELCESLHNLVSYYQQDAIVEGVCVDSRERPCSTETFEAAEVASSALRRQLKIKFEYHERGLDGREAPIAASSGSTTFEETPIALVYSFGNYYLETWTANERFPNGGKLTRRLDKMRNATISESKAESNGHIEKLRESVDERTTRVFDMWGDGVPRTLFLMVESEAAKYVYDRFGSNLIFRHIDRELNAGYACVVVELSPTFYRWLFGMGGRIAIAAPRDELWVADFWKSDWRSKKPFDELVEDYMLATAGYKAMLDKAYEPYC